MNMRWAVFLVAVFFSFCGFASAGTVGPQIGIGDPTCPSDVSPFTSFQHIFSGNTFSVVPNSSGGGYFGICNQTGTTWSTLQVTALTTGTLTTADVHIYNSVFSTFSLAPITGGYKIDFSGGPGVGSFCGDVPVTFEQPTPSGCLMTLNLNSDLDGNNNQVTDPNGAGDWTAVSVVTNVPEPTSLALLGSGLLCVWQYRRRRK